uniref:Si:dkey-85k7.10 n=1 Tax=Nothobranchius furzeri TaxID=105023 RepID=A0A8C6KHP7_NOTFU
MWTVHPSFSLVTLKQLILFINLTFSLVTVLTCVLLQVVHAGVVGDFNHAERCKDSLFMGTPPRGYLSSSYKKICQRYEDKPRYSDGEKKVDFPWMFEPQLASEKSSRNMEPFPQSTSMHMNFEDSQTVLEDYADVVLYERGQLNPDEHQADPLDKASTYSLTNVVPQIREFNMGPWAEHQDIIRKRLNNYCLCHHWGHDLGPHDPPQQHGPCGCSRVHVVCLLLHRV